MTSLLIKRFIKNSEDVKDPSVRGNYGLLGSLTGILCNLILFAVKLTIGIFSGSVSVLADAFNNLSDIGSSAVTLLGFKLSRKPPDREHPFGHGRMEYMSGFIVSLLIVLVGVQLFRSSIDKVLAPEELSVSFFTVAGLLASIFIKLWMCIFNRKLGRLINSGALKATALDSLTDSVATSCVLIAVGVSAIFGINIDPYMGIAVAVFIIFTGLKTAKDTLDPLLGKAPDPALVKDIGDRILSYEGFIGFHDLIVHNYGPGRTFVSVHVEVPADADILRCHEQIDRCERETGEALRLELLIHMDPIVTDDEHVNEIKATMAEKLLTIHSKLTLHDFRIVFGENRTNLIFDVVIPGELKLSNKELKEKIGALCKEIDPTFCPVVNLDIDYTVIND